MIFILLETKAMFANPALEIDFKNREFVLLNRGGIREMAGLIDSTLLRADSTDSEIDMLCREAADKQFRSVCVAPSFVTLARGLLNSLPNCNVLVCTVVGFPIGYQCDESKIDETKLLIKKGADEIDFVQNCTDVKQKNWDKLGHCTTEIVRAADGKLVKVILETSLLSDEEIAICTRLHGKAGAHVIKTSTGFGARGASVNDLQIIANELNLFEKNSGIKLGIKASGGIRSSADAMKMIQAGATRLGTSGGASIIAGKIHGNAY